MIKKFEEYIAEGMWKSGLDRAKQNTLRTEDVFSTNVDSLMRSNFALNINAYCKGYFAENDIYFPSDKYKDNLFHEDDMKKIVNYAKNDKWKLPTYDDMKKLLFENGDLKYSRFSFSIKYYSDGEGVFVICKNDGTVFPELHMSFFESTQLPIEYWLLDGYMTIGMKPQDKKNIEIKLYKDHTNTPKRIRLYQGFRKDD